MGNKECCVTQGVPQGSILSPTMFLTAFDGLILELKKHGLTCLAYADDLAVVSKGR